MANHDERLLELVNRSGFPLQLVIEEQVRTLPRELGWEVAAREHAWEHPGLEKSGFVDLVAENQSRSLAVIVEAKRVQDSDWLFIRDSRERELVTRFRGWVNAINAGRVRHIDWTELKVDPPTHEASFCVVRGQDERSAPMLERVASELIEATSAIAFEDQRLHGRESWWVRTYCSVVVTTARLLVSSIDPGEISATDGKAKAASFAEVRWVRFFKQFSSHRGSTPAASSLSELAKEKEQTVFVVQAQHFPEFLQELFVNPKSFEPLHHIAHPLSPSP